MGLGGISIWQLLIILAIVVLVFGTKRLTSLGGDLGGALRSFRKAMDTDDSKSDDSKPDDSDAKQLSENADANADADFAENKNQEKQS